MYLHGQVLVNCGGVKDFGEFCERECLRVFAKNRVWTGAVVDGARSWQQGAAVQRCSGAAVGRGSGGGNGNRWVEVGRMVIRHVRIVVVECFDWYAASHVRDYLLTVRRYDNNTSMRRRAVVTGLPRLPAAAPVTHLHAQML